MLPPMLSQVLGSFWTSNEHFSSASSGLILPSRKEARKFDLSATGQGLSRGSSSKGCLSLSTSCVSPHEKSWTSWAISHELYALNPKL